MTSQRTTETTTATQTLDTSGLLCPLPVYKAAIVLNGLSDGDTLRLVTTDPGALQDIPAMARQRGDTLIEVNENDNKQNFLIQKGTSS
jgi:tRNA 2-thiouridine synthesizing protein A